MNKNGIRKIVYTIIIFVIIDLFCFVMRNNISYANELKQEILVLEEEKKEFLCRETTYKDGLQRIIKSIYASDHMMYVGGIEGVPIFDYNAEDIYSAVMNSSVNFDELLRNTGLFFSKRDDFYNDLPNIFPIKQNPKNRITSPFGTRVSPFTGELQLHNGMDVTSVLGAETIATANGRILHYWIDSETLGKYIIIQHKNGIQTLYAHLSESFVHEGQYVKKGEVIGRMGNSGKSKGDHVHYEIRKWDGKKYVSIDPLLMIRETIDKKN